MPLQRLRSLSTMMVAMVAMAVARRCRSEALEAKEAELQRIKCKKYEEVPLNDYVYVFKEVSEESTDVHKIGRAIDTHQRKKHLNTGSARGIVEVYKRQTFNAAVVERVIQVAQKRYQVGTIGGQEHYNNGVHHSVDSIDMACVFVETISSMFEHMTREEKVAKLVEKFNGLVTKDTDKISEPPLNLDMEYEFLKSRVIVPAHEDRKAPLAHVAMLARTLYKEFEDWRQRKEESPGYETSETKFGNKMGAPEAPLALVSGAVCRMPGVFKKKTEKGWRYSFDVNAVYAAMLQRKWIIAEDSRP